MKTLKAKSLTAKQAKGVRCGAYLAHISIKAK